MSGITLKVVNDLNVRLNFNHNGNRQYVEASSPGLLRYDGIYSLRVDIWSATANTGFSHRTWVKLANHGNAQVEIHQMHAENGEVESMTVIANAPSTDTNIQLHFMELPDHVPH
jgi:hypothetical protein